jgi:hypothetical protein
MGVFVLRCNLAPRASAELWNTVANAQLERGEMATLLLGARRPQRAWLGEE